MIEVIGNGLNFDQFKKNMKYFDINNGLYENLGELDFKSLNHLLSNSKRIIKFGYVGRFAPRKGIEFLK